MKVTKNVKIFLCVSILELCFYAISILIKLTPNYVVAHQGSQYLQYICKQEASSKSYDIRFTPPKDNKDNFNIVFLPDGSFTVGSRLGVPKIYGDGIISGRYGNIASEIIETNQFFKSIIVKIDKIDLDKGEAIVVFRARDDSGNYTEWIGTDGHKGNKVTFYPDKQYKFLECMVSIITNDIKKAPIIRSISVKLCN